MGERRGFVMAGGTHEGVFCRFAIPDETVRRGQRVSTTVGSGDGGEGEEGEAYLALASLTLIRGRARSSLSRWLCSVRRRSLSSDMDCLCGREFMVGFDARGRGASAGCVRASCAGAEGASGKRRAQRRAAKVSQRRANEC